MANISDTPWAASVRAGDLPGVKCVNGSHGPHLAQRPSAVEVVAHGFPDYRSDGSIESAYCAECLAGAYPELAGVPRG